MNLHKQLLTLFAAILLSGFAANATSLHCGTNPDSDTERGNDSTMIVVQDLNMGCLGSDGEDYNISVRGVGAGFSIKAFSGLVLACTAGQPQGNYWGVRAEAAVFLGFTGAVFGGKRGFCSIGGGSMISLGASASLSKLTVRKGLLSEK